MTWTWIDQLDLYTEAVIFSDSLSGLMAIKNANDINFVNEILTLITHLQSDGKTGDNEAKSWDLRST